MAIHTQEYETINADAIIAFLSYLLSILPGAGAAHHSGSGAVSYLCCRRGMGRQNPRIKLHFLPAYSPNLNTIERVWKIMHEHTVNNAIPNLQNLHRKNPLLLYLHFPKKRSPWGPPDGQLHAALLIPSCQLLRCKGLIPMPMWLTDRSEP